MRASAEHPEILKRLRGEILAMEGYGASRERTTVETGLGPIERAFPESRFPTGAVHEFISPAAEHAAATSAFITGLASAFIPQGARCVWISSGRMAYPPALRAFGISPDRIIFVDLRSDTEALWALEEALHCAALPVVIGELRELDFTQSRRLQLAVEQSRVTAFIHRKSPRRETTTASLCRWKIAPLPSIPEDGLPGVGFPRWQVSLLKVRNGRPGSWTVEWAHSGFRHPAVVHSIHHAFINQTA